MNRLKPALSPYSHIALKDFRNLKHETGPVALNQGIDFESAHLEADDTSSIFAAVRWFHCSPNETQAHQQREARDLFVGLLSAKYKRLRAKYPDCIQDHDFAEIANSPKLEGRHIRQGLKQIRHAKRIGSSYRQVIAQLTTCKYANSYWNKLNVETGGILTAENIQEIPSFLKANERLISRFVRREDFLQFFFSQRNFSQAALRNRIQCFALILYKLHLDQRLSNLPDEKVFEAFSDALEIWNDHEDVYFCADRNLDPEGSIISIPMISYIIGNIICSPPRSMFNQHWLSDATDFESDCPLGVKHRAYAQQPFLSCFKEVWKRLEPEGYIPEELIGTDRQETMEVFSARDRLLDQVEEELSSPEHLYLRDIYLDTWAKTGAEIRHADALDESHIDRTRVGLSNAKKLSKMLADVLFDFIESSDYGPVTPGIRESLKSREWQRILATYIGKEDFLSFLASDRYVSAESFRNRITLLVHVMENLQRRGQINSETNIFETFSKALEKFDFLEDATSEHTATPLRILIEQVLSELFPHKTYGSFNP